ncbi:hypothetical protein BSKO_03793 [Bryopsis sp. KO-2023]|nr:hypothetical protein BSKO_03793 [Bryopsis sp. KO-2023]
MELKVASLQEAEGVLGDEFKDAKRNKRGKNGDLGPHGSRSKELRTTLFDSVDLRPEDQWEVESKLRVVQVLLKRGKAEEALELIEKTLPKCPDNIGLITQRGSCYLRMDNAPAAFACFSSCLKLDPLQVDALMGMGSLYKTKGMLSECVEVVNKAYDVVPNDKTVRETLAMALTDLGTKLKEAGHVDESIEKYTRALTVCETYAPAYYNLGVIYSEMGMIDRALGQYEKSVELEAHSCMAWCNMGNIYKDRGTLESAIACYEKALASQPNCVLVNQNLALALSHYGTQLKVQGKFKEGVAAYERALAHDPKCVDALYNLGVAFGETREFDRAIFMYEMAISQRECAEAYNNLGAIYKERDNMEKAVQCYVAALNIRPNFPQSLNNLGVVYTAEGRAQEAMALLQAALSACPEYAEAYNNIGVLQRDVGLIKDAIVSYEKCLELCKDSRNAGQNKLLGLNYIIPGEDPYVSDEHAKWGEEVQRSFPESPIFDRKDYDMTPNRALRVGYISPDLYTHSVSYFAEAPLAWHNQRRVHHVIYNCSPKFDAKSAKLKTEVEEAGGEWKDVMLLSDKQLAEKVKEDRIDILVELTGQFANNRLGTMAMKPAPVQVTWIGYPNSTGLKSIDYRFTDEICDPLSTKQSFVEELVRLPGCFLCYTPISDPPPVSPAPCIDNGFVTFGSFNALAKITKDVIKVWSEILHAVPNSRMVLKNKPFACETTKAYFMNMFKAEGIESWRVDLLPLAPQTHSHLSMYSLLDISLDPWPYAGTTTTCESMFMGVPCVTLTGGCHAHNVGVSLINAVGLGEGWIAQTKEEYVELVVNRVQDMEELAEVRAGLRQKMLSSRMCDAKNFVMDLEDVYHKLWDQWVGEEEPTPQSSPGSDDPGMGTHFEFNRPEDDEVSLSHDFRKARAASPSQIPRPQTPIPRDESDSDSDLVD